MLVPHPDFPEMLFVLEGQPPLEANQRQTIRLLRAQLQEKANTAGDFFPIPADVCLSMEVVLKYPPTVNRPNMLSLTHIKREIAIGILYVDNYSIYQMAVEGAVAKPEDEHPEGCTIIKIQVLVDNGEEEELPPFDE